MTKRLDTVAATEAAIKEHERSTDERVESALPSPVGYRIIEVDYSILAKMLLPHDTQFFMRTTDAPSDLRIVEVWHDATRQNLLLLKVTSSEWESMPDGYVIPRWIPMLKTSIPDPS